MGKWEVLQSEKILDSEWLGVEKQVCKVSDKKILNDYYVIKRKDFVIIVAEDKGDIFFLKQYRHGIQESIINLPMGLIDKGETPYNTAMRELLEETGYQAESLDSLGEFCLSPSTTKAKVYVFYANKLSKKENFKIDEGEGELEIIRIPKTELVNKIKNGEIKDMGSVMAIHLAGEKLGKFGNSSVL